MCTSQQNLRLEVLQWSTRFTLTLLKWLWLHASHPEKCHIKRWCVNCVHDFLHECNSWPWRKAVTQVKGDNVDGLQCLAWKLNLSNVSKSLKKLLQAFQLHMLVKVVSLKINQDKLDERFQYCPLLWLSVWDWAMREEWNFKCRKTVKIIFPRSLPQQLQFIFKSWLRTRHESLFFSFPPALFSSAMASHASSRLPSLIFSLLFLLLCPHSIHFHSPPLRSLYSCFHFNPIAQSLATLIFHNLSQSFHKRSDKLFFTSSTCLSSFSSFFQPSQAVFFLRLLPSQTFSFCLSQHALTSTLSNVPSLPPVSAKPSMGQLSSLAWCLF